MPDSTVKLSVVHFLSIIRFRLSSVTPGAFASCHGVPSTCSLARILVIHCVDKCDQSHEACLLRRSDGESELEGILVDGISPDPPVPMKKTCRKTGKKGRKLTASTKARTSPLPLNSASLDT